MNIDMDKGMDNVIDKILSLLKSLTVVEANELAKKMEAEFGFSLSSMMSGGGAPAAVASDTPVAAKNKIFTIIIKAGSSNKIAAIKCIRVINKDMGIKEAKELVENGGELISGIDNDKCEECKKSLGEVNYEVVEN